MGVLNNIYYLGVYRYSIDPALLENIEPSGLIFIFRELQRDDGTSDHPLFEGEVLETVANLNIVYNELYSIL